MGKRVTKTAAELMAELEHDPAYQRRLAENKAIAAARGKAIAEDERVIVTDLAGAGVQVASVCDFVGPTVTPQAAVPVLLRHLQRSHIRGVREGILRAFAYSHLAPSALSPLLSLFPKATDPDERWLIANAIGTMVTLDEVAQIPAMLEFAGLFAKRKKDKKK